LILPDQGKTLLACDMAARSSVGSPLAPAPRRPGERPPQRVLIMTNEDTLATTMVPRLLQAGADLEQISFIQMVRDPEGAVSLLTLQDDLDALERALVTMRPALVVIDGVVGYLGPDVKSHNDHEVRRVLTPFAALLARTRTAGLGLMHPPKAVTNLHYYAGGSIAFTAVPRVVLGVAPDPEDESPSPRRFLAKLKGNLYGRVPTLAFRIRAESDGAVPWIEWEPDPVQVDLAALFDPARESPEDRGSRRRCENWLRSFLADGPQHARDVEAAALASGFSPHTLRRAREAVCDSVKVGQPGGRQGWDWLLRPARVGGR
jgi:putative DNA primase/helicase